MQSVCSTEREGARRSERGNQISVCARGSAQLRGKSEDNEGVSPLSGIISEIECSGGEEEEVKSINLLPFRATSD